MAARMRSDDFASFETSSCSKVLAAAPARACSRARTCSKSASRARRYASRKSSPEDSQRCSVRRGTPQASAAAEMVGLAADLACWRGGRPPKAGPAGRFRRLWRKARRRPVLLGLLGTVVMALAVGWILRPDPNRPAREAAEKLKGGEPVELLG